MLLSCVARLDKDSQKFISLASDNNDSLANEKIENIDKNFFLTLLFGSRAVLNSVVAMFGDIVGQQVVKAQPLFQVSYIFVGTNLIVAYYIAVIKLL